MYRVIHFFTDLQDDSYPYHVGDTFPRDGVVVSDRRLDELSSKFNLQGKPLIERVDDFAQYMNAPEKSDENDNSYSKEEIAKMPVAKLRELAKQKGIENAGSMSKAELKKIL